MKKVFSIFAIGAISTMLVACGGEKSQTSEAAADSTVVETEVVDSTVVESTEVEAIEEAPASVE
jgi:ABC-type glycerol-3-phosphate transport system substrate-binding protein